MLCSVPQRLLLEFVVRADPRPYHRRRRQSLYGCPAEKPDSANDESGSSGFRSVTDSAQRIQEGANQSEFGLEALQGINGESGDQGSSSGGASSIIVAAAVSWPLGGCFCCSHPGGTARRTLRISLTTTVTTPVSALIRNQFRQLIFIYVAASPVCSFIP
jgi:hypothetical protein